MITQHALQVIANTIVTEGGFVNNPADKGGPTKYGITQATYNAEGYPGSVENCTVDQATAIYSAKYWNRPNFSAIDAVDSSLTERLFDWGVTSGPMTSTKALQRALNVLNRNALDWPDLIQDGVAGNMTVYCLNQLVKRRGADGLKVIRGMVQSLQSVFFINIAETEPTQETFEYGWQLNRAFGA